MGGVATQSFAEVTFGVRGLELLASGRSAEEALRELIDGDAEDEREQRQVGIVDSRGGSASFTGTGCFEFATSVTGPGFACQGNIMASDAVVPAMAEAYVASSGPLAERLIVALRAAQRAGGDRRGQESAAVLVVKEGGGYGGRNDRYIDLRVDHHDDPIEELSKLLGLHRLYFERPHPEDILAVGPELEEEVRGLLRAAGGLQPGQELWSALETWAGMENLEERWAGEGRLDPQVLAYLRARAARR